MTSNLGCEKNSIGFGDGISYNDINKFFGTEFVNRIGSVIRFDKISFDVCQRLVNSSLSRVRSFYKKKGICCSFSNKLVLELIDLCEYEKYGARKLDNIISLNLESLIVDMVFEGKTKIRIDSIIDTKVV